MQKHSQRLIICNIKGFPVCNLSLEEFMQGNYEDTETLINFFSSIIKNEGENNLPKDVIQKLNYSDKDPNSYMDAKSSPEIFNKYNQLMKEVNINWKREIIKRIIQLLPEPYWNRIRTLNNLLEVVKDKQNNVIIRMKKKSYGRQSMSNKNVGIITPKRIGDMQFGKHIQSESADKNKSLDRKRVV